WVRCAYRATRYLVLRFAGLRGASCQLRCCRQGRCPGRTLVSPGALVDDGERRDRARVLERQHVRVPDARTGDAVAPILAARPDPSRRGAAPDSLRARTRGAVGDVR